MVNLPRITAHTYNKHPRSEPVDHLVLTYDDRFLRRRVLTTQKGEALLVDLAKTLSLDDGGVLLTHDNNEIGIIAAPEPLYAVKGDLPRLAWHIGNRHTPCQIEHDHLLIQRDPVIAHMLQHLDATLIKVNVPFTPEGGAYGHGRTHAHAHGATAHEH